MGEAPAISTEGVGLQDVQLTPTRGDVSGCFIIVHLQMNSAIADLSLYSTVNLTLSVAFMVC